jgi:GT2 family glycosyltransferase
MQREAKFFQKSKEGFVSILICSKNRREALETLARDLLTIKPDHTFEIIVVEETDDPTPIKGTTYVSHPIANRGIAFARNLALSNATGDLIVFLDDDCIITDAWLDNLLEPFKDDSVVGVQGGVNVPHGTNAIGWAESILGFPGGGIRRVFQAGGNNQETQEISTLNCAFRKRVFDKVGGFDERLKLGGEDYLFAKQACEYGRCLFVPKAIVSHEARGSLISIWHWFVRRGRAEVDIIRTGKQKDTTVWTILRSSFCIKLCFLILIGLSFSEWFIPLLLIGLLTYCLLQFLRYYKPWRSSGAKTNTLILLPLVKLVMDFAMDWGRLKGIIFD